MRSICISTIFYLLLTFHTSFAQQIRIPIESTERQNLHYIELTEIGAFGLVRKERPEAKSHLHTGIDIKRPDSKYDQNPIYPVAEGLVVSKRDDGPFAQLIIEHHEQGITFWTVYEHIAGILVETGNVVNPDQPIARFMNREELDRYGWQFDHFHFEVLKVSPIRLEPNPKLPGRHFNSYTLICFEKEELNKRFYHPLHFLAELLGSDSK